MSNDHEDFEYERDRGAADRITPANAKPEGAVVDVPGMGVDVHLTGRGLMKVREYPCGAWVWVSVHVEYLPLGDSGVSTVSYRVWLDGVDAGCVSDRELRGSLGHLPPSGAVMTARVTAPRDDREKEQRGLRLQTPTPYKPAEPSTASLSDEKATTRMTSPIMPENASGGLSSRFSTVSAGDPTHGDAKHTSSVRAAERMDAKARRPLSPAMRALYRTLFWAFSALAAMLVAVTFVGGGVFTLVCAVILAWCAWMAYRVVHGRR